ncbi:MAG: DUF885 domain-containing protein [Deltaproteobacteria bacterium]
MRRNYLVTAILTALVAVTWSTIETEGSLSESNDAAKRLHALFQKEWDFEMEQNPVRASEMGDRRWNDRWPEVSLAAIRKRHEHEITVLDAVKAIDRAHLSRDDQLNYDLFQEQVQTSVEGFQYHWYLIPFYQREGIQLSNGLANSLRFETVKDYEDWLARLRAFPIYMDQTVELCREGMREHMMLPKVILERVAGQIDNQIVEAPTASPYFKPFEKFPDSIPVAEQTRLRMQASMVITKDVIGSFIRFKKFFDEEYLPTAPVEIGIWKLPNGAAMYAYFAREHTTTNLTPEKIHAIGLKELARINAEMNKVMEETGFKGTRAEFFKYLRTDPRFHYNNPADLLEAYRATAKRIDPHLVTLFRTLPRMPYGVEPIPAIEAPDTTAAYYRLGAADGSRAGTFMVNLYKPESRPKWEMMALALHESVPGHHLQIALGMEQQNLPKFRRYGYYDAFGEGWGLYAESLGEEMGLYDDPYSKFGELAYDMWRAVRLVIDTGMHTEHWSRQKAIDYFMENCPKDPLDITNEVDRYIAWPGQALAYKIGQLKIRELRNRASNELGPRFDLKEFHEVVLRDGAVPLDILEKNVNDWIAEKKAQ